MINNETVKQHVETTGELLATAETVRKQRQTTNRLTAIAAAVTSLAVLVAMLVVFMVIKERNSSATTNGERIDQLTVQLQEAREDITAEDKATRSRLECQNAFDTQIRKVALEYLASIGELVVVISSLDPNAAGAEQVVDEKIELLNLRLEDYRKSIALLEQWRTDVPPSACPL